MRGSMRRRACKSRRCGADLLVLKHLLEEIALGAVEPFHQLGDVEEALDPLVDYGVERRRLGAARPLGELGAVLHRRAVELELRLDEGRGLVPLDLLRIELRVELLQRARAQREKGREG